MNDSRFLASLKIRHYQLLIALDEMRNVGKVAAAWNISQPAVSKSIADIEAGLGVRIFERSSRGLHPTRYGTCLIRHARNMVATLAHVTEELHGILSGDEERLTVGTNAHAALGVIPHALVLMKQRFPTTTIIVREGATDAHLTDLWLGKLDIFVGRIPHAAPQGLEVRVMSEEPMKIVAGVRHPLAKRRRVPWARLRGYAWVLPPVGTPLREPLDRALQQHGLPLPDDRVESLSVHAIQAYLTATDALAILAPQVASYYERLGLLKILPLEIPQVARASGMIWYRDRAVTPALRAFMGCVEASYQRLAG